MELIRAICVAILKDHTYSLVASLDEESSNKAKKETERLLKRGCFAGLDTYATENTIKFQNGSVIEFVI